MNIYNVALLSAARWEGSRVQCGSDSSRESRVQWFKVQVEESCRQTWSRQYNWWFNQVIFSSRQLRSAGLASLRTSLL